ncbi:MAG: hypothetical protein ACLR23_18730 [Clostridia bacterium]
MKLPFVSGYSQSHCRTISTPFCPMLRWHSCEQARQKITGIAWNPSFVMSILQSRRHKTGLSSRDDVALPGKAAAWIISLTELMMAKPAVSHGGFHHVFPQRPHGGSISAQAQCHHQFAGRNGHVDFLQENGGSPYELISCRYNRAEPSPSATRSWTIPVTSAAVKEAESD